MTDKCKCNMKTKLVGDGCRYCNAQEFIDNLIDKSNDLDRELSGTYKRIAELENAEANLYFSRENEARLENKVAELEKQVEKHRKAEHIIIGGMPEFRWYNPFSWF